MHTPNPYAPPATATPFAKRPPLGIAGRGILVLLATQVVLSASSWQRALTLLKDNDVHVLSFLALTLGTVCLVPGALALKSWPRLAASVLLFSTILLCAAHQFWRFQFWGIGALIAACAAAYAIRRSIAFSRQPLH